MSDIIRRMAQTNLALKYPERTPTASEQDFFNKSGVPAYAASDGSPVVSSTYSGDRQSLLDNERYRLFMQGSGMNRSPGAELPPMTQAQRDQFAPYGYRTDGSPKGSGFMGPIPMPGGGVATEQSFDFEVDGKNILAPLIVPGYGVAKDPEEWAVQHALRRIDRGESPFADTPEYAKPNSPYGKQTMIARILAGDPSAKSPTPAQQSAARLLEAQAAYMINE